MHTSRPSDAGRGPAPVSARRHLRGSSLQRAGRWSSSTDREASLTCQGLDLSQGMTLPEMVLDYRG